MLRVMRDNGTVEPPAELHVSPLFAMDQIAATSADKHSPQVPLGLRGVNNLRRISTDPNVSNPASVYAPHGGSG